MKKINIFHVFMITILFSLVVKFYLTIIHPYKYFGSIGEWWAAIWSGKIFSMNFYNDYYSGFALPPIFIIVFILIVFLLIIFLFFLKNDRPNILRPFFQAKIAKPFKEVKRGDLLAINRFLQKNGDVNFKDENGKTLLMHAAMNGKLNVVQLLLENGADVNIADSNGETALMEAVSSNYYEVVKLLIDSHANLEASDVEETNVLMAAAGEADIKIIELLISSGCEVNKKDKEGETALMYATYAGESDTVKLLISKGANVNVKNIHGISSLMIAASEADTETAEILISAGANINDQDNNGESPLVKAVCVKKYNNIETIKLFLDNDAIVDMKSNDGKTVLKYAEEKANDHIINLIKSYI